MKPLKILQIGPIPYEMGGNTTGGVAFHLWELSTNLVQSGCEVYILVTNPSSSLLTKKQVRGINLIPKPSGLKACFDYFVDDYMKICVSKSIKLISRSSKVSPSIITKKQKLFWGFFYISLIEEIKPDITHIHHVTNLLPLIHKYFAGTPFVCTVHSWHAITFAQNLEKRRKAQLIARYSLNATENLIFVSNQLEREMLNLNLSFKGNTFVIYNPVDEDFFKPIGNSDKKLLRNKLGLSLHKKIALFVGNKLEVDALERKGIYVLINATEYLKEFSSHDWEVVIIGGGPAEEKVNRLIIEKKLDNIVKFIGWQSRERVAEYYRVADLMVLPTFSEGFGLTVIESLLSGLPVVTTTAVPEEIIPYEYLGGRIKPGDWKKLAHTMEDFVSRKWNVQKMREFALNFGWKKKINDFICVYNELLKRHKDSKILS